MKRDILVQLFITAMNRDLAVQLTIGITERKSLLYPSTDTCKRL